MHVCDYSFVSDGKPGIIGIFEEIRCPGFPVVHPLMSIALKLRGQPGHLVPIRVVLEAQDGTKVIELPEVQIPLGADGSSFGNVNMLAVKLQSPGRYSVVVTTRDAVLATKTLKVLRVEAKAAAH